MLLHLVSRVLGGLPRLGRCSSLEVFAMVGSRCPWTTWSLPTGADKISSRAEFRRALCCGPPYHPGWVMGHSRRERVGHHGVPVRSAETIDMLLILWYKVQVYF